MLPFKLHDFGFRGSTSYEAATLGGAGHLIPFMGTDNVAAINLIKQFYSNDADYMPTYSIPAAKHSTIIAHADETGAYKQIWDRYPVSSIVSDSYDYVNAVRNIWCGELQEDVQSRLNSTDHNLLVIRPDSGNPVDNVLWTLQTLADKFGATVNDKGFKALPRGLAVIQGDGIDPDTLAAIADALVRHKWSLDSVVFGSGGGLLQKISRDTQRYTMKASSVKVGGHHRPVRKMPSPI